MQTDVNSAYTTTSAALVSNRTRIKGINIVVVVGGASPVILYDNATTNSGVVLLRVGAALAGSFPVVIPGEGILAKNGVYCDVGSSSSVTLFYG